jgi:hypothetical protein
MRGRPVLGAISGLFFGLFLALLLQQFGIWPLDNLRFFGLPAVGLILGLLMAWWAPFGRQAAPARAAAPAARPVSTGPPPAARPPQAPPPHPGPPAPPPGSPPAPPPGPPSGP